MSNTVSIGYYCEDGDFAVLATLNNNDGIYTPETFNKLIKNIFNELYVECDMRYPDLIVLERQDAPDCVQIDD